MICMHVPIQEVPDPSKKKYTLNTHKMTYLPLDYEFKKFLTSVVFLEVKSLNFLIRFKIT